MEKNSHNTIGNLQDLPNSENFKKVFKRYLVKWSMVYAILICFVSIIAVCINIPKWQFSQWLISLFMDTGAVFDGKTMSYGVFAIGMNLRGIIVAGINVIGAFAFGVSACGIVAIGANVGGVIAIGGNAVGIIAIGGNAFGVVAVGYNAFGIYALSYSQISRGKYLFAPHRQDAKAVAFFTRWFPRLVESGFSE